MLLLRGVAEVLTGGTEIGFQGKFPGFRFLGEGIGVRAADAVLVRARRGRDRRVRHAPDDVRPLLLRDRIERRGGAAVGRPGAHGPARHVRRRGALLSGVAGILYVAYLPAATPSLGNAYELHAVAAAVLGGCSLQGGKGSVFGVLIGAGIMQITFNAVNLVGQVAVAERRRGRRDPGGGDRRPAVREEPHVRGEQADDADEHVDAPAPARARRRARLRWRRDSHEQADPGDRARRARWGSSSSRACSRIRASATPSCARCATTASCRARDRLEVFTGSIESRDSVAEAMAGVTHVLHLATSKETPESIMDVAVKGLFWLLEACRTSPTFKQFILIGGDAGMGHFFYPHPIPVTETQKHSAYPGCYALSKVLEEVMLEQYYIQYDLPSDAR